ncbi:hypothetical protein DsansV1_C03g0034131 [Dioscorea sansibarensis]
MQIIRGANTGEVNIGKEIYNHASFVTATELIQKCKRIAAHRNKNGAPSEQTSATTDFANFSSQATVDFLTHNSATSEGKN